MNTPLDHDREDLRYAEYALGVLDAAARAQVECEIESDPRAAAEVARWQGYFSPLAEDIPPSAPPDYVRARLRDELGLASAPLSAAGAPRRDPQPRRSWWDSLALWRWMVLSASAVAAACAIALLIRPSAPGPSVAAPSYMVARILQDNGLPGWIATMDPKHARMTVVPAAPNAIAAGRAPELWLIPEGGKPIALGVIPRDQAATMTLRPDELAQLNAHALLAVSVEPPGGSPTGQPTGPVIAKGTISAA